MKPVATGPVSVTLGGTGSEASAVPTLPEDQELDLGDIHSELDEPTAARNVRLVPARDERGEEAAIHTESLLVLTADGGRDIDDLVARETVGHDQNTIGC